MLVTKPRADGRQHITFGEQKHQPTTEDEKGVTRYNKEYPSNTVSPVPDGIHSLGGLIPRNESRCEPSVLRDFEVANWPKGVVVA